MADNATFKAYSSEEKDGKLIASFDLDDKSVEFLESKLGAKINPHIETAKDYFRTVFYFKCCGIQEETDKPNNRTDGISPNDCVFSKEKADLLFEDIHQFATESDAFIKNLSDMMDAGNMPSDDDMMKFMDYQTKNQDARLLIMNDSLYSQLEHQETDFQKIVEEQKENNKDYIFQNTYDYSMSDYVLPSDLPKEDLIRTDDAGFYQSTAQQTTNGNLGILRTASMHNLANYLQASPNLAEEMNERYNAAVTMAAADVAPHLPEGANLQDYLPIVKEHPKAVLALAITAEANKESKIPFTLSSPEELLSKCQHPAVVELSDKISFNDLNGSKKAVYAIAQPVVGLGRESMETPTISRAKVNEG